MRVRRDGGERGRGRSGQRGPQAKRSLWDLVGQRSSPTGRFAGVYGAAGGKGWRQTGGRAPALSVESSATAATVASSSSFFTLASSYSLRSCSLRFSSACTRLRTVKADSSGAHLAYCVLSPPPLSLAAAGRSSALPQLVTFIYMHSYLSR